MRRSSFIKSLALLSSVSGVLASCRPKKKIGGRILGASAAVGHLLRDQKFGEPVQQEEKKVVIIGGGISGLSAGRYLRSQGISDFVILDLEEKMGGNAASGENAVSKYPLGAHYIPIPNNTLTEYMRFLEEGGVITGYDDKGLPVYNDYFLCFDPHERLYINGQWQEGLVPHYGVPVDEQQQISRFLAEMTVFRNETGADEKEAFAIPVDQSSRDPQYTILDKITMSDWMKSKGFTSPYLQWYVNYCTRDDFGTRYDQISAWAGIHYFASRKGRAANASYYDVITWPEGNHFLVSQLEKNIRDHLKPHALAVRISETPDHVEIDYYDTATQELKRIRASQCIMAVPQFVAGRLLSDPLRLQKVKDFISYTPWMVANLEVQGITERDGAPLSWDNVIYTSASLGYVEATHQLLPQQQPSKNLTYYLPLTEVSPSEERNRVYKKTHDDWVHEILDDLRKIHPNIEDVTKEINVMVWGHAMARPVPGMIFGGTREELSAPVGNHIHFAHTDLAGISIFEEGFYQGLNAAKQVCRQLT